MIDSPMLWIGLGAMLGSWGTVMVFLTTVRATLAGERDADSDAMAAGLIDLGEPAKHRQ